MVRPRIEPPAAMHLDAIELPRAEHTAHGGGSLRFLVEIALPWIGRQARSIALGCVVALGGCGGGERVELSGVVRDGRTGAPIAHAQITTDDGRTIETDEDGRFSASASESLVASAEGRCDAEKSIAGLDARQAREITLHLYDRLELEREHTQVGFDAEVRIEVRTRCDDAAELTWTQLSGPALGDRMRVEDAGRVLVVRTHPLEELVRLDDRPGAIALDRRQRGDYRFTVRGQLGDHSVSREARVVAAPTSAGLYQVPTGGDVYFNGGAGSAHGWRLADRPRGSRAELASDASRVTRLRPDRFGTYLVEHRPSGLSMNVQAGPYDEVPRDCGREGCHVAEDEGWTHTAHARTFRRGLEGELGAEFDTRCWSCHATGVEPGIDNGGLHHTASRIGWDPPPPDAGAWEQAPRRIRREGSVWCSACHGPGRIVPPPHRWQYGAKFQVGVCARCHDADEDDPDTNHVSLEVDEWRLAGMSGFVRELREDDPALRSECAQCHSAQGFVAWQRGQAHEPDRDTVAAITCAACHDPHDASRPHALRVFDDVDAIGGAPAEHLGSGALCASCHRGGVARADDPARAAHAPQADVMIGRGARLVPATDEGAHRFIANTCVRCHMSEPAADDPLRGRAGGHTFSIRARVGEPAISSAACSPCHGDGAPEAIGARDWDGDGTSGPIAAEHQRALATASDLLRARIARASITDSCAHVAADVMEHDARLHLVDAAGALLGDCDGSGRIEDGETAITASALPRRLADAAHDLALLRADGSSGVHNPEYAFRVLSALTRALR